MIRRRRRPSSAPRAPSAPPELKRRRLESVPSGDDVFPWKVGEVVVGVSTSKRGSDVLARCQALYGGSTGEDAK